MTCLTQSLPASSDHPSPKYAPHIIPLKPQAKPAVKELPLMFSHTLFKCAGVFGLHTAYPRLLFYKCPFNDLINK